MRTWFKITFAWPSGQEHHIRPSYPAKSEVEARRDFTKDYPSCTIIAVENSGVGVR